MSAKEGVLSAKGNKVVGSAFGRVGFGELGDDVAVCDFVVPVHVDVAGLGDGVVVCVFGKAPVISDFRGFGDGVDTFSFGKAGRVSTCS